MYNIKFSDYIPAPSPAKSDRIVAAHYYAAWKKGAAGVHEGFDDLAEEFPDRTPLMGYYDEENPEVCDWEIKWALEHGINCFLYCWYRRKDNEGKPVTVSDLRCGHGIHEALFNSKYGNMMNFAIMFEASPRWGGTDEKDMIDHLMPFWTETYFKRENYLKIDNKPVLLVFWPDRLLKDFGDGKAQRRVFDECREYARKCGFDGMIFAACDTGGVNRGRHLEFIESGYDFTFGYNAYYNPPCDFYSDEDDIIKGQCESLKSRLVIDERSYVLTPSCFSDSTPRFTQRWIDLGCRFRDYGNIWYLSPEKYRVLLEKIKDIADSLPEDSYGRKMVMIDNWNEWDEGHFVAPSHKFGFKYLQAVREVFTKCDNLPDYRLPQSIGLGPYDQSIKADAERIWYSF